MREFRNLTKDQFAEAAKLTLEDVENFEDESLEFNGDIAEKYARICQAHSELSILEDQIKEFKNPGFFESRRSVAHSALKQMGIVMPGVDYSNLNCASAQVLPMRGFRKNENSFKAKE